MGALLIRWVKRTQSVYVNIHWVYDASTVRMTGSGLDFCISPFLNYGYLIHI